MTVFQDRRHCYPLFITKPLRGSFVQKNGAEAAPKNPELDWLREYLPYADYFSQTNKYGSLDGKKSYDILSSYDKATTPEEKAYYESYINTFATENDKFGMDEYRKVADSEKIYDTEFSQIDEKAREILREAALEDPSDMMAGGAKIAALLKYNKRIKEAAEIAGISEDEAKALAKQIRDYVQSESRQETSKKIQDWATQNIGTEALSTISTYAVAPLGNLQAGAYTVLSGIAGETPTSYNDNMVLYRYVQDVRNAVGEDLAEKFTTEIAGQNVAQWLYQAVNSMADSAVNMAITGGILNSMGLPPAAEGSFLQALGQKEFWVRNLISNSIMGSGAAVDAFMQAKQQGMEPTEALIKGIAAGIIEGFTEAYGGERIVGRILDGNANWVTAALESFLSEGTEEYASNELNRLIGYAFHEDNVTIARNLLALTVGFKAAGYDDGKAWEEAAMQALTEDISSFLAGGLSGLLMGGGGRFIASTAEARNVNNEYSTREHWYSPRQWDYSKIQTDVGEALENIPGNRTAERTLQRAQNQKAPGTYALSRIRQANYEAMTEQDKGKILTAVTNQLRTYGETGDVDTIAQLITKKVAGETLTKAEQNVIDSSKYGARVSNEVDPANIISGQYNSGWAENIGTKVINPGEYTLMGKIRAEEQERADRAERYGIQPRQVEIKPTGNQTVDSLIEKAYGSELSNNDVRTILDSGENISALEGVTGSLDLNGKSASEQRAAVKEAISKYVAANPATAAPASGARIENAAKRYGKQARAVTAIFNLAPTQDISGFMSSFNAAYQIGYNGGTEADAMNDSSTQNLTEVQRRLAYYTGAATKSTEDIGKQGKTSGRKGVVRLSAELRAAGVKAKDINSRFKSGSNQATALEVLRKISELTGVVIELYDSSISNYNAAQGEYNRKTDVIGIDIAAGLNSAQDVENLAKYAMLKVFSHEFTHFGEKWAPGEYNILRSIVFETLASRGFDVEARIRDIQNANLEFRTMQLMQDKSMTREAAEAEARENMMSWDMASREVVAEGMVDVLPESQFMQKLYEKSPSVFQKLLNSLKEWIDKIRSVWYNEDGSAKLASERSPETNALKVQIGNTIKYVDGIVDAWDNMVVAATENYRAAARPGSANRSTDNSTQETVREAQTATAEDIDKEGIQSVTDDKGGQVFSLRTMKQDVDYYMQDLRNAGLVGEGKAMSEEDLDYLYKSINRVMNYVEAHLNEIERLESYREMDGTNRPFLPYKDNSDPHYKMALDYSTLCRKRLLAQAITERLQAARREALTPGEQVRIRNEIQKLQKEGKKLDVACALCYVEAARLKSPKVINEFLKNKEATLKNYFSLNNKQFKNEVYLPRQGDWKEAHGLPRNATKNDIKNAGLSLKEFQKFLLDVRDGYWKWAEQYDPETFAAQKAIIDTANAMDNSEFLNAQSLAKMRMTNPDLYDAFIFKVRSATRSKAQETDVPYSRGDINNVSQALIDQMNEESGFRHQSWSDFQAFHLLDTISAIIELATRDAKVHTYTKVADMVRFLGNTGMMMNMSLIPNGETGLREDGSLDFDPVEGIDYDEMLKLRDEFHATAGNIAIGISDDQIRALLASPYIDYVIPYHTSGLNADMRRRMGIKKWKDYTRYQNESGDGIGPRLAEWYNEKEALAAADGVAYMVEASKKYLELCAERGLTPKFAQFLTKNSDGSYSLSDDAQNYWKLLIDRKMVDQVTGGVIVQQAVQPRFDVDTMLDILSKEVNSQAAIDAREAEDYIVNKILNEKGAVSKADLAKGRAMRDAAVWFAIEDSTQNSLRNTQQDRENTEAFLRDEGGETVQYSIRQSAPPTRTRDVYKLMRYENGKLYPLFIGSTEEIQLGVWYDADSPSFDILKDLPTGNHLIDLDGQQVLESRTKNPTKAEILDASEKGLRWMQITAAKNANNRYEGQSRLFNNWGLNGTGSPSTFALRPGWHAGSLPVMEQIGNGKMRNVRADNLVWVKGRIAHDIDYQAEAESNPSNDIALHLPTDGSYIKGTSSFVTKGMTWYISGAFIADRILSDREARAVVDDFNDNIKDADAPRVGYDWAREGGRVFDGEKLIEGNEFEKRDWENTKNATEQKTRAYDPDMPVQYSMRQRDADYLAAVERGDMETAQRMVDEAAEKAGYNVIGYHGTDASFNEFKYGDIGYHIGTEGQARARIKDTGLRSTQAGRKPHVMKLYAKIRNPLHAAFDFGDWHGKNVAGMLVETEQWEEGYDENAEEINARLTEIAGMAEGAYTDKVLREYLKSLGYDGVEYENQFEDVDRGEYGWDDDYDLSYIAFDSSQLKLADPVTYDDDGNVIPLSERFDSEKDDIRYSMRYNPSAVPGVNINDSTQAFTEEILNGTKTVETRESSARSNHGSLYKYVGQRVGIVRTGKGKATLVGWADIAQEIEYGSAEEFRADYDRHRIAEGSEYDWHDGKKKFGYVLENVTAEENPYEVTEQGIVVRADSYRDRDRDQNSKNQQRRL